MQWPLGELRALCYVMLCYELRAGQASSEEAVRRPHGNGHGKPEVERRCTCLCGCLFALRSPCKSSHVKSSQVKSGDRERATYAVHREAVGRRVSPSTSGRLAPLAAVPRAPPGEMRRDRAPLRCPLLHCRSCVSLC
jgi:hypothetical protein